VNRRFLPIGSRSFGVIEERLENVVRGRQRAARCGEHSVNNVVNGTSVKIAGLNGLCVA
jgi:hypothetical protein